MDKSAAQRKAMLLEGAWPGVGQVHHPHLKAYRRDKDLQHAATPTTSTSATPIFLDAYKCRPSINLEDLQKGNTQLHFINARGRHAPCTFAHVDAENVGLGVRRRVIASRSVWDLSTYEMDVHGDTPETYGSMQQYRYGGPDVMFESRRMDVECDGWS